MADISEQTQLATSTPEEAAQHIENSSIFDVNPSAYKNFKDELNAKADELRKPTEAGPVTKSFMQQSTEHAALAVPDVDHLSYLERQASLISDYLFDRPTVDKQIIGLSNKKMHAPEQFTEDDQIALDNANYNRTEIAKRNYGLDGPIEKLPAQIIGGLAGMVSSGLGAVATMPGEAAPTKENKFDFKGAAPVNTDIFHSSSGASYNELSNMVDENGKPLNIDESTKKTIAMGVGVVNVALQSALGFGVVKAAPFLAPYMNSFIAKSIVANPTMAAVKSALVNIAGDTAMFGTTGGLTEVTNILGEEIGRHYDGTPESFLNGLTAAGDKIKNDPSRVFEAAGQSAAIGFALGFGGNVAGFSATKSRFQTMSDIVNEVRTNGARDVTPIAPKELTGQTPNPDQPIDVTPEAPVGGGDPVNQSSKVLHFKEALENMIKVANQTNMEKVSPGQLSNVTKMIFDGAGLDRVWMGAEDFQKVLNDPKHGETVRNLLEPSGVAAAQQNAPVAIEPHKFMELVKQYPEAIDMVRVDPEGPTPLKAESYLSNLHTVEQKRQELLKQMGAGDDRDLKTWFGDSKIVDQKGEPLVVYHGSGAAFKEFKPGKGIYFSSTPETANWAADNLPQRQGQKDSRPVVYPVHVNMQNPFDMTPEDVKKTGINPAHLTDLDIQKLKNNGYDGVRYGQEIIAFNPSQIRSKFSSEGARQIAIEQALAPVKSVGDPAGGMDWHGDNLLLSGTEYLKQPTFTKAIAGVIDQDEITRMNDRQLEARRHVLDAINDKANEHLIKLQDAELKSRIEEHYRSELAKIENDPNYEIVDKVTASLLAVKGTKTIGIYQVDPATLTDAQLGKYLTNPRLKEYGIFRKGARSLESASQMAGTNNGEQFLEILVDTPTREQIAKARTYVNEATIAQDVLDTVQMDETKLAKAYSNNTKNHIEEMKFMKDKQWPTVKAGIKRIALPIPRIEELTNRARGAVQQMKVGDLSVSQFKVGERASQRAALTAILKNEVERAFMNKEAAALNSEFQKEVAIAIGNANKVFNFARRFKRPQTRQVLKEAGPIFEKAANEILDTFKLDASMRGQSEAGSYRKWIQERAAAGEGNFEIPERLADIRSSARELTVEQLGLIGDRLRAILHTAKLKNKLLADRIADALAVSKAKALETEERLAAELHELAVNHPDYKDRLPTVQGSKPAGEQVRAVLATAQSLFNNLEHIVTTLDGEKLGGRWHELLVKPIKGDGKYNGIMGESGASKDLGILKTHLEKIIEAYGPKDFLNLQNTIVNVPEFAGLSTLNGGRLSKGELIGLMLNGGDPDGLINRENLGVSNEIINKVLDRELEERDAVYAQSLIDAVGSYGPRSVKLHKETTGQDVTLIKGVPFMHRGHSYPGGYWPQSYVVDYTAKSIAQGLKDRTAAVFGGKDTELYARQYAAEMTEQGRLQERTGSGKALNLSVYRQARVFEEIIHDLNYRVPVRDTLKILRNKSIREDMVKVIGPEKTGVVVNTIVEAANQIEAENNNFFSDQNQLMKGFFGTLNSGMSVGLLAANLSSIMIQPVSLASTVQKMGMINGTKHLLNVTQKMARNPLHAKAFYEFAAEINPSIRNHMEGIEDSLTSTLHDLLPSKNMHPAIAPIRRAQHWMTEQAMAGMGHADQVIKTIGTLAAYEQFMAGDAEGFPSKTVLAIPEAERHQKAMDYARQLSRTTLTHGAPSDKAPVQKLPLGSFFVKFWNDLRNVFNTTLSQSRKAKWALQDMNEALGQGHEIPDNAKAMSAGKNAGAILMGMVVTATITKMYEDYWRHRKTPFDENFDFKSAEGLKYAHRYMTDYMLTSAPEIFVESIPGVRDIKYGSEKVDRRTDTRNAKVPLVKIADDMATSWKAIHDMLTVDGKKELSPEQTKSLLFVGSYLTGGYPVNAAYRALRWWNENEGSLPDFNTFHIVGNEPKGAADQAAESIKKYIENPPKGTTEKTINQLKELHDQIEPKEAGIPLDTYDVMKKVASSGNWTKINSANGAAGVYQFTDEAWKDIQKRAPELGLTDNGRISKDQGQQEKAIKFETEANAKQLSRADLPLDAETLYSAHIFGVEKAKKLYQASADTKLKSILKVEDLANTPELQDFKTVGQVRKLIKSQVNDKRLTLTSGKTED